MGFLRRFFSSQDEQKRLAAELGALRHELGTLEFLEKQFGLVIDFTPDSEADLTMLVKALRLRKKQVQADKRTVAAQMADIRTEARQRTGASAGVSWGKWERREIRWEKEAALRPHESEKAALARQMLELDHLLGWLERFK